ncbi:hypothetical protein [[Clostridium] innocuum]|uniref:hypothetical protein n=1 Tax=Clostridium innocuum TaxID=1522 RepID=UPI001F5AF4AB|nr:hypothetical protein [[Clostridium] innocuum]MCI3025573.1 hypothetical protein [[Clostridium] innocuum]
MNDMIKKDNLNEFGLYESIRNVLIQARKKPISLLIHLLLCPIGLLESLLLKMNRMVILELSMERMFWKIFQINCLKSLVVDLVFEVYNK